MAAYAVVMRPVFRDVILPRRPTLGPRVEHRSACSAILARVPRHDRQAVVQRGCGDEKIRLRISVPGLAPLLDQKAPSEKDVFAYFQDTICEQRPDRMDQPIPKFG